MASCQILHPERTHGMLCGMFGTSSRQASMFCGNFDLSSRRVGMLGWMIGASSWRVGVSSGMLRMSGWRVGMLGWMIGMSSWLVGGPIGILSAGAVVLLAGTFLVVLGCLRCIWGFFPLLFFLAGKRSFKAFIKTLNLSSCWNSSLHFSSSHGSFYLAWRMLLVLL